MVRALVHELCVVGLDVPTGDVDFEIPIPEVRGRIDALFGSTVFEFKRNLRHERSDAEEQLTRYISERERVSGRRYLGISTDGAEFVAYELSAGRLVRLDACFASPEDPNALVRWLDSAIAVRGDLEPRVDLVRAELGRESLVFRRSLERLRELWADAHDIPEVALKRDLWSQHLEFVYGTLIHPEELFLQHTYLTIVAKVMAVRLLTAGPIQASDLLAGTQFAQVGLDGAVETDFFDWVLLAPGGADLVERISAQVTRFRLSEIEVDVLKGLYESLIDPRQRHYLGEYYTPDWLAEWICREAIPDPLSARVLDPACGSGTFLFHTVRRYLAAAEAAGQSVQEALEGCTDRVLGIDVHPVAVLFSRVTYLLAIGSERLRRRTSRVNIPVYLGDALQWNVRAFFSEEEVEISVPGEPPLRFPGSVAGDPGLLDSVLRAIRSFADQRASVRAFASWINAHTRLSNTDRQILGETYERIRALHDEGRNHIWTFVVRNLTRPLWLTLRAARPTVLIGNPPWLRFNAMSRHLQNRFREASRQRGLWVGGKVATQQDMSSYFFARAVERYLPLDGCIVFVMPYATLSRAQYQGFRTGRFVDRRGNLGAIVRFDQVWTFDSGTSPLFPVPSAVIFAHRAATASPLPRTVTAFRGTLPRRDASSPEARRALSSSTEQWPSSATDVEVSAYRDAFKNGATLYPRRLLVVEQVEVGALGGDDEAPLVQSRIRALDKRPWSELNPLRGQIERQFLRSVFLGESIAPFRALTPAQAVIPWDEAGQTLLNSEGAIDSGHQHLAAWLRAAEVLWREHGSGSMSLLEQIDYNGKLRAQFPIRSLRVVYAKAGTWPAACIIADQRAVIDHKLYWICPTDLREARYLTAILNSESVRSRISALQSEGQFGPRDFDKVMFSLPIPRFNPTDRLHHSIALAAEAAERVAAAVSITPGQAFQVARRRIREAIRSSGMAARIDALVDSLLEMMNRRIA